MLIEVKHLSKRYGTTLAVDDVSFCIEPGEILGLLGPNGAGKTTTIHMLLGLITPSTGEVRVFGQTFADHREEILQQMNFTSPYVSFPLRLTVMENLSIFARLYNVAEPRRRIGEMLELFGVEKLRNKPIARLSSGETTRVGLCTDVSSHRAVRSQSPAQFYKRSAASRRWRKCSCAWCGSRRYLDENPSNKSGDDAPCV